MKVEVEKVDNPSQLNSESAVIHNDNFPSPILRKNKNYLSKIKIKLHNDF